MTTSIGDLTFDLRSYVAEAECTESDKRFDKKGYQTSKQSKVFGRIFRYEFVTLKHMTQSKLDIRTLDMRISLIIRILLPLATIKFSHKSTR